VGEIAFLSRLQSSLLPPPIREGERERGREREREREREERERQR